MFVRTFLCVGLLMIVFFSSQTLAFTTTKDGRVRPSKNAFQQHRVTTRMRRAALATTTTTTTASGTRGTTYLSSFQTESSSPPDSTAGLWIAHEAEIGGGEAAVHHHHGAAAEAAASSYDHDNIMAVIVHNPVFWSCVVMITIVSLLLLWEELIENLKERTPKAIVPVIENMLIEMGSLGFIGIVLSVLLNRLALGDTVGNVSETFLGERDLLLETFEYLHEAFFQVGILFFTAAGGIVVRVLQQLNQITTIAEDLLRRMETTPTTIISNNGAVTSEQQQVEEDDCDTTAESLARILSVFTLPPDFETTATGRGGLSAQEYRQEGMTDEEWREYAAIWFVRERSPKPFWRELTMSNEERGAEALVIRERLIEELDLPKTFRIHSYLENVFALNKLEIVDLSPLSWLPLIPAIALSNALDLTHDVVSPESANAFETSGYFFSTWWVLYPSLALQVLITGWGLLNFWKMAEIKAMLMPTLVRDGATVSSDNNSGGNIRLLPPPIENLCIRKEFCSTPAFLRPLEQLWSAPAQNINQELFGTVGANGPEVYLTSQKFHSWLCVASIFFFSSQILPRDMYALSHPTTIEVGDAAHLLPELVTFGTLVVWNIIQLVYLAPTTFLNYCLATSVEDLKMEWAIEQSIEGWDGTPIRAASTQPSSGQEVAAATSSG